MDVGFETVGNATLICHDRFPVLITDPWITGTAYFGSWTFWHDIPEEQLQSIRHAHYAWISHGHPDHLNRDSLPHLRDKIILLPDHVGGRIAADLKEEGYRVQVLRDRTWYKSTIREAFQDWVAMATARTYPRSQAESTFVLRRNELK